MADLARRDMNALAEIYDKYGRSVRAAVVATGFNLLDADVGDVCHEVFLTAMANAPRYRHEGRLKSWLCGIAVRKVRGMHRRRALRRLLLLRFRADAQPRPVEHRPGEEAETRRRIAAALERLSEPFRQVMILHVVENMSSEEIASALSISVKTVWTRLHRARQLLREELP